MRRENGLFQYSTDTFTLKTKIEANQLSKNLSSGSIEQILEKFDSAVKMIPLRKREFYYIGMYVDNLKRELELLTVKLEEENWEPLEELQKLKNYVLSEFEQIVTRKKRAIDEKERDTEYLPTAFVRAPEQVSKYQKYFEVKKVGYHANVVVDGAKFMQENGGFLEEEFIQLLVDSFKAGQKETAMDFNARIIMDITSSHLTIRFAKAVSPANSFAYSSSNGENNMRVTSDTELDTLIERNSIIPKLAQRINAKRAYFV